MRVVQVGAAERERLQQGIPPRTLALLSPIDPFGPVEQVHLGIFDDTSLKAVITLEARGRGLYEIHLALQRGQGVGKLLPAFFSIRHQLFEELAVKELIGWVPTLHTGIQRLAATVGFHWTGATLLQMSNNRLTEWRQLSLRTDHGQ